MCSPDEERQRLQARTHNEVSTLLRNSLPALVRCSDRNLGQLEHCPAASCSDIDAQSLAFTGLGVPVEVQCRSTVTWTGCAAATALEGGHVLPTST